MNILKALADRASTRLGQAVFVVIISTLLLRFPWLVSSWADDTLTQWVMSTADSIRNLALPIILLFAKQFNETGGTVNRNK